MILLVDSNFWFRFRFSSIDHNGKNLMKNIAVAKYYQCLTIAILLEENIFILLKMSYHGSSLE